MRRAAVRTLGVCLAGAFAGVGLVAACGARTGLYVIDASVSDVVRPPHDVTVENPFDVTMVHEGHPLDVMPECTTPTYCVSSDPNYIYKCGERVYQCGSLEQCFEPCVDGATGEGGSGDACAAECINPCLHTLGQNTSNGCEFYAAEMDQTPQSAGVCYAVFLVNQWETGQPAQLAVDLGGKAYSSKEIETFTRIPSGTGTSIVYKSFDSSKGLAQNQIAILFLSRDPSVIQPGSTNPSTLANCPPGVTPAVVGDAALHGTGVGTSFHIRSNVPIVAYQMLPYGGGHARVTGATLLLPTNVWGTNYVAANAYSFPPMMYQADGAAAPGEERAGPTLAILAQEDNTHVTINPVSRIEGGGGLSGTGVKEPITYTVHKGHYLQFTQKDELTGSAIQSDAPVAVLGGSTLIDLPTERLRADHAEQMLPPVQALGSEYVAVRYRSRNSPKEESVPWRIVGAVDGTRLSYDPAPPPGAPPSIDQGQVIEIDDPGPWVISSQDSSHPFYFAQYMTGGSTLSYEAIADAGPDAQPDEDASIWGQGDPEFVNVVPALQFLPSYTFFTDPTYPETNLVIVTAKDMTTGAFPTVNLDCAGTLSGWQPVGTSGKYQFTRLDLSRGNYVGQNGCNNGVHTIRATLASEAAPSSDAARMGVTVWGWGSQATHTDNPATAANETDPNFSCWVSYAYPVGANFAKLNDVVVPAK